MIINENNYLNKLFNEDCMVGISKIDSNSVDLILCDLPYGTTQNKWDSVLPLNDYIELKLKNNSKLLNKDEFKVYCFENEKSIEYFNLYWTENYKLGLWSQYKRILKDNAPIVLFGAQPFTTQLINSNVKGFKYDWVWAKTKGTGHLNAKKQPLRDKEDILVFYEKQCKYFPQFTKGEPYDGSKRAGLKQQTSSYGDHGLHRENNDGKRYPRQIIKFDIVGRGSLHPTQKPIELLEYLIKTYTNEGDIVLDNCMGVGSTAVSCINTNRNFIGFELNEDYYLKSIERLKGEIKNGRLL